MIDDSGFLLVFPEFAAQPAPRIQFWLDHAARSVDQTRWGDDYETGIYLLAAHHLALAAAAGKSTDGTGGLDAAQGGVASESKSMGGMSKSISHAGSAASSASGAGNYAATSYGQQFYDLSSLYGIGGMTV